MEGRTLGVGCEILHAMPALKIYDGRTYVPLDGTRNRFYYMIVFRSWLNLQREDKG